MRSDNAASPVDTVLEVLEVLWTPGVEAMRFWKDLNVRSLEEMIAAAERAGCEVCYADLPANVSGFATVIEGTRFIVVNRAKPRQHAHYTVSHELGHHILHLSRSRCPDESLIPGLEEFQAHMFAASWVVLIPDEKERTEVMRQNPESVVLVLSAYLSVGVILFAVLAHLASHLFSMRLHQPEVRK